MMKRSVLFLLFAVWLLVSTQAQASAGASLVTANSPSPPSLLLHVGLGVGAGILSVPAGLSLAAGLGSLSNSLVFAALPALLAMGLVAPTITTLAVWLLGEHGSPGRFGFWAPWAASFITNTVALVVAGMAGFTFGAPLQLLLFSVIDGALVGGVSAGSMRLFESPPPPAGAPLASAAFLPILRWSF